jgi:Transposase DDE domain
MSANYDQLLPALKRRLPAAMLEAHGRVTDFIRRLRTVGAADFVWSVVLSRFAGGLPAFDQARRIFQQISGEHIWPRPFQMRFKSAAAVQLMSAAFETAVAPWRHSRRVAHRLARHFPDIVTIDSTIIRLHDRLRRVFPGQMGTPAELKVTLALSVFGLVPLAARLTSRKIHDSRLLPDQSSFRPGSLLLFDNAYAAAAELEKLIQGKLKFIAPMRLNGNPIVDEVRRGPKRIRKLVAQAPDGLRLAQLLRRGANVKGTWDLNVRVRIAGGEEHGSLVPMRLVIRPGRKRIRIDTRARPRRRTIVGAFYYLTNVDHVWSGEAIAELYRLRWQVELAFKELKQHLSLESVPTRDQHAAQVLVWASLLALVVSRTIAAVLTPLRQLNGLAARLAVAVTSRALRGAIDLLILLFSRSVPRRFAREIAHLIASKAARQNSSRADSFLRLLSLAPA